MKCLYIFCLACLVLCLQVTGLLATDTDSSVSEEFLFATTADLISFAQPAVVFIRHRDASGREVTGAGFLVNETGTIVTCAHMVEETNVPKSKITDKIWVRTYDGLTFEATRGPSRSDYDVAFLKIEVRSFPYLDITTAPPKIGDEILVIGFPLADTLGSEPSVTKGIVSSVRLAGSLYQIDAPVNPGNSGGPVLSKDGYILGLLSFKVRDAEGIAFAVSAKLFPLIPPDYKKIINWNIGDEHTEIKDWIRNDLRRGHIAHNTQPQLCRAARGGDVEFVEKLLESGVNPNIRDAYGATPLAIAAGLSEKDAEAKTCRLLIAQLLLDHGADLNAADNNMGDTPLHQAVESDFPEFVSFLLEHGAKVDPKLESGATPLAFCFMSVDSARILLQYGADPNNCMSDYRDEYSGTILDSIRRSRDGSRNPEERAKYDELLNLLYKYGAKDRKTSVIVMRVPDALRGENDEYLEQTSDEDLRFFLFLISDKVLLKKNPECLACGSTELSRLTLLPPSNWPTGCIGGQVLGYKCKKCGVETDYIVWFKK